MKRLLSRRNSRVHCSQMRSKGKMNMPSTHRDNWCMRCMQLVLCMRCTQLERCMRLERILSYFSLTQLNFRLPVQTPLVLLLGSSPLPLALFQLKRRRPKPEEGLPKIIVTINNNK